MKRQLVFGTVMAAALTVGLGAQSPTPQSPAPQSPTPERTAPQSPAPQTPAPQADQTAQDRAGSRASDRGQMLTLTGCLSSDVGGVAGTSGTAPTPAAPAAASSSDKFVLTDAVQSATEKPGANPTGTAGTASTATIPSRLQLTASGNSSANWSRYLNHKVEVKGRLDNSMSGATAGDAGAPKPAQSGQAGAASMTSGGTFHVTSIKEVAGSCSGSSVK
jgi:hypothetical protein